jgi:two-component system chemotaxis response regulator CheY
MSIRVRETPRPRLYRNGSGATAYMSKRLLIVDDSATMRKVLSVMLTGAGYEVLEACDGQDGLAKVKAQNFDLIISDVNMPVIDGLTFIKVVKQIPAYKLTPIIMLTTETQASKLEQARATGIKVWVVKPFQPKQMLAVVSKLVSA